MDDELHDMLVKKVPVGAKLTALMVRPTRTLRTASAGGGQMTHTTVDDSN